MFARGLATRNGLRAFLVACAVFFSSTCVIADNVTITFSNVKSGNTKTTSPAGVLNFTGTNGSQTVNVSLPALLPYPAINNVGEQAGHFNWTVASGGNTTVLGNVGASITTFCIELRETISTGQSPNYTLYTDLSTLPKASGPAMGSGANALLQKLADAVGQGTLLTAITGSLGGLGSYAYDAVLQATIWKIDYNSALTLHDGTLNTLVGNIITWLNGYTSTGNWYAVGLSNGSAQDQLAIVTSTTYGSIPPVPAPAGVVLAGMAFACVGGYNFLRRRKAIAAA